MDRVKQIRDEANPGDQVVVSGWVRTRRDSKQGFSFIELNDGSCLGNLQVVADQETTGFAEEAKHLTTGASIRIEGIVQESPGKGQRVEVRATDLKLLGVADPETFPLQKKRHTFEYLREIAHLRPRSNTFGAIARVRNAASWAINSFFQSRGFLLVHTPIITTSDCEGAGQMFRVTTLNLERIAELTTTIDYEQDFFGKPASLTVSGQLEAEIFATSTGPCYTFGPTFRAENSNTTRHLAEFWMVEPEIPFFELPDNMELAEAFIKSVISHVLESCPEDMEFFDQRIEPGIIQSLQHIVDEKFERVSYTDAIEILTQSDKKWEFPVEWGHDLQSEHERFLTEEHFRKPIILFDYPRSIKPFYMRCNEDGKTVRAMDVLVPRIGEIIGGSQREERLDVLCERLKECGLHEADYWWYLDLRRYGTVPHSGFGLGFERLIQLLTGMQNIRDCIPFPRTPKNAEF